VNSILSRVARAVSLKKADHLLPCLWSYLFSAAPPSMRASLLLWLLSCVLLSVQQPQPASSWPVEYDDQPSRPYSPAWQNCAQILQIFPSYLYRCFSELDFRVGSLLNVDWTVGRGFAGNVDVMREGHPNNTLYFWAWEKHEGSLTAPADPSNHEPWMIWLNGGWVD
jgi:carboxypeptidase D